MTTYGDYLGAIVGLTRIGPAARNKLREAERRRDRVLATHRLGVEHARTATSAKERELRRHVQQHYSWALEALSSVGQTHMLPLAVQPAPVPPPIEHEVVAAVYAQQQAVEALQRAVLSYQAATNQASQVGYVSPERPIASRRRRKWLR